MRLCACTVPTWVIARTYLYTYVRTYILYRRRRVLARPISLPVRRVRRIILYCVPYTLPSEISFRASVSTKIPDGKQKPNGSTGKSLSVPGRRSYTKRRAIVIIIIVNDKYVKLDILRSSSVSSMFYTSFRTWDREGKRARQVAARRVRETARDTNIQLSAAQEK